MDVGINHRWTTASTMTSGHHFHSTVTQNCQNLTQIQRCNSVRMHLYACVPHWKVLKHFLDVHYGYEKQSKVVISLNHDIMASFPLDSHPELPKSDPASAVLWCKGALICLRTSLKGARSFYICPILCVKQSKVVYSLNHDIMTSFPLDITQNCQNHTQLQRCHGVRVHLSAYVPDWKVR